MAWNEPGGNHRDRDTQRDQPRDPWNGGPNHQGPPDLDDVLRKLQDKLSGLFGSGGGGGNGSNADGGRAPSGRGVSSALIGLIVAAGILLWGLTGLYTVDEAQRGVVLRFGQHVSTTNPGLNWHLPTPIERVEKVDILQVQTLTQKSLMLTEDENIVNVELAAQYRIKDPAQYLFQVRDPRGTLQDAIQTAIREIVGQSKMDYILTDGRAELVVQAQVQIQDILDSYRTGLELTKVNLKDAQPPEEVQAAFSDAIKAREDEERLKNEAEAYAKRVVNNAQGDATRLLEEADAYKAQVTAKAEGDVARFDQLLGEYEKAPDITRERLYLDAVESVLSNSSKVMLNVEGGNNLLYLPLDRLMQRSSDAAASNGFDAVDPASQGVGSPADRRDGRPLRNINRGRGVR